MLVSAVTAWIVWKYAPASALDHAAFTTMARGFSKPPLFVSGRGTHTAPWQLRASAPATQPDARQAPVVISLGDDPTGFFQSSPPAPIDMAVILSNFHRLGAKKAAVAAVLAWDSPDVVALAALEKMLGRFDSLVMTAPLSRGAVPSPILPAFRRASLEVSAVRGDVSGLPVVNRCPIPDVILGGENSWAGFSVLDSEAPSKFAPLLARWDDRIILSFPLLTVLQQLDLPLDGVEVQLGATLKLSGSGPVVPIDRYGRLALPLQPLPAVAEISAEHLVGGDAALIPGQAPSPMILRDDRSAAEPATRAFSNTLLAVIVAVASEAGLGQVRKFPRLSAAWEIVILGGIVAALTLICGFAVFARHLGCLLLAGFCVAAQWIGAGMASVWLPWLPALAAILSALVVASLIWNTPRKPAGAGSGPHPIP